jgi:hypothetical protein
MNATTNQLSIAVAAALPAPKAKQTNQEKSAVMKAAHAIQKAAAKAWNCSVREILFSVCLKMARAKETFCNKEKTMISLRQFSVAISLPEVRKLISAAANKFGQHDIFVKAWEKGEKVRLYLTSKGIRRNTEMGYITIEDGKVVMPSSGWAHMATQEIIAAVTSIIEANAAPDGAEEATRNAWDTGTNVAITTYDAKGRIIRKSMAD